MGNAGLTVEEVCTGPWTWLITSNGSSYILIVQEVIHSPSTQFSHSKQNYFMQKKLSYTQECGWVVIMTTLGFWHMSMTLVGQLHQKSKYRTVNHTGLGRWSWPRLGWHDIAFSSCKSSCKLYCSGRGYSYHGMTSRHWCWCGNTAPSSDKLATGCDGGGWVQSVEIARLKGWGVINSNSCANGPGRRILCFLHVTLNLKSALSNNCSTATPRL